MRHLGVVGLEQRVAFGKLERAHQGVVTALDNPGDGAARRFFLASTAFNPRQHGIPVPGLERGFAVNVQIFGIVLGNHEAKTFAVTLEAAPDQIHHLDESVGVLAGANQGPGFGQALEQHLEVALAANQGAVYTR